jgi:hypothetical protein
LGNQQKVGKCDQGNDHAEDALESECSQVTCALGGGCLLLILALSH